jgi:hypothetical protein
MSTRERWIVYPLLFMTLGIAMRDKVTHHIGDTAATVQAATVATSRIRCNELRVGQVVCDRLQSTGPIVCNNLASRHVSECETLLVGRTFLVNGPKNRPVVVAGTDNNTSTGFIETFTADGLPQIRLYSNNIGGMMTVFELSGKLMLSLGQLGREFGLFAEVPELGQLALLTLPFQAKPVPQRPSLPSGPSGNELPPLQRRSLQKTPQ